MVRHGWYGMEIFEITLPPSSSITNSAIYTRNLNGFAHITFLRHAAYQSRTQQRLIILKRHYQFDFFYSYIPLAKQISYTRGLNVL